MWKVFLENHVAFLLFPLFLMGYLKTNFSFGQSVQWLWASRGSAKDVVWSAHSSDAAETALSPGTELIPCWMIILTQIYLSFFFLQILFTVGFTQNSLIMVFLSTNYTLMVLSCMHTEQCKELYKQQKPIPNLQLCNSTSWVRSNIGKENSYRITTFQLFLPFSPFHLGKNRHELSSSYLMFLVLNCSSRNTNYSSRWTL